MTPRPTPRRSALSNQSVITPAANDNSTLVVTQTSAHPQRTRISIRGEREFMDRARAAWFNNIQQTGIMSFNDYVIEALHARIQQDEQTYNNGQPYEGRPPGTTPIGRR